MVNRIAFTFFYLVVVVIFYLSCPYQWKENKTKHRLLIAFCCVGFVFIFLLINCYRYFTNDAVKNFITNGETFCYCIVTTSLIVNILKRYLLQVCVNKNRFDIYKFINQERNNVIFISLFASIYLIASYINMNNIAITKYDVNLNEGNNHCKIAFIADLHLGSGLQKDNIDKLVEMINENEVQYLLIGGDIVDSSTGEKDLDYLKNSLKELDIPIYCVIGNHESDSVYDYQSALTECNVTILDDETIQLDDNLVLVGRNNSLKCSVDELIENNKDDSKSYIILQHDPSKLDEINLDHSLVIAGHTHGYQFPYMNPSALFFRIEYGRGQVNQSEVIVTSGISVWGHHCTFPSENEMVLLEVDY